MRATGIFSGAFHAFLRKRVAARGVRKFCSTVIEGTQTLCVATHSRKNA